MSVRPDPSIKRAPSGAGVELKAQNDFERNRSLRDSNLVSQQVYEETRSALERAQAEHSRNEIQLAYTEIRAPFSGLVVRRYIKDAETVANNQALFRISDVQPITCSEIFSFLGLICVA